MLHMLLGVARGMEWLHARNVLHGDLKAANVLLKSPDGGRGAAASFSGSHSGAASQRLGGGPGAAEAARAAVAESVMAMVPKVADFGLSRWVAGRAATLKRPLYGKQRAHVKLGRSQERLTTGSVRQAAGLCGR
jgi:serine/threonine protein kinase